MVKQYAFGIGGHSENQLEQELKKFNEFISKEGFLYSIEGKVHYNNNLVTSIGYFKKKKNAIYVTESIFNNGNEKNPHRTLVLIETNSKNLVDRIRTEFKPIEDKRKLCSFLNTTSHSYDI